jgi:uncharacterized protein (TIGR00369 family)
MLGLHIDHYDMNGVQVSFDWKDELIGNPMQKILHGGVTSSVLDVVGGMMAVVGLIQRCKAEDVAALAKEMKTLGTIDLRTDFLRPGWGEKFVATANIVRSGNKLCVCHMELHNDQQVQIAQATGTYML